MTAQEKAEELFNKYFSELRMPSDCEGCMQCVDRCGNMVAISKKYAFIAVDEVMSVITVVPYGITYLSLVGYWEEVREEIEKI